MIRDKGYHNDKGIYTSRKYNNCKYLCSQHQSTLYIKQKLTKLKGKIKSNSVIVVNATLSKIHHPTEKQETTDLNNLIE